MFDRLTGGDDILIPYAGKDITIAMADEDEHVHSKAAYQMLDEVSPRAHALHLARFPPLPSSAPLARSLVS